MKLLAALILGAATLLVLVGMSRRVVGRNRESLEEFADRWHPGWRDLERCDSV